MDNNPTTTEQTQGNGGEGDYRHSCLQLFRVRITSMLQPQHIRAQEGREKENKASTSIELCLAAWQELLVFKACRHGKLEAADSVQHKPQTTGRIQKIDPLRGSYKAPFSS